MSTGSQEQSERDRRLAMLVKLTKPAPSDILPPAWPHLLRPPRTVSLTGDKMSEYLKPMGNTLIQITTVAHNLGSLHGKEVEVILETTSVI